MRLLAIALLLLAACVQEDHGTGIVGTPDDMTTLPGDYVGYRVTTPCVNAPSVDVGVIGTGNVAVMQTADISAAGNDLHTRLTDLASIWGWGGYGLVCDAGVGTQIYLRDWRDVDTVIARTGTWLRDHDYALQVAISVEGVPVPLASD